MELEAPPLEMTAIPKQRAWLHLAIGIAVVAFVIFATVPSRFVPLGPPGLDPSWKWAVNQARESGQVFGRDIVFTYGPLAFLMVALDIGSNLVIANAFLIGLHLVFGAGLVALFVHNRRLESVLVFVVLYVFAIRQVIGMEGRIVLAVGVLAFLSVAADSRIALALASATVGVLVLTKMSLGLAALILLAAALAFGIFMFRWPYSRLLLLLPFPVVLVGLAVFLFDAPRSFFDWVSRSLDVVSGYSVANSILGPASQVVVGVTILICWLVAAYLVRRDRPLLVFNLLFAPVLLVEFRLAFVRQDNHQVQFVPFVLGVIAISALIAGRRRQLLLHVLAFAAVLGAGAFTGLADPIGMGLPRGLIRGGDGPRVFRTLAHLDETRAMLASESARRLAPLQLPESWLGELRRSTNGVGTLPWEIQYCPANDLPWNPTPTIQLYTAYTADLDQWSASHYAGGDAPGMIINEYVPMGRRHQMIDAPATWRTIFLNYRLIAARLEPTQTVLLERRPKPLRVTMKEIEWTAVTFGAAAIGVPQSDHLLFANIDLRFTALGRLQKALFRIPWIYLVLHHESGHTTVCRLIPGTAGNGILINRFPHDFKGYRRLWQGVVDDPVVRMSISGPGSIFFRSDALVTWREMHIVDAVDQAAGGDR